MFMVNAIVLCKRLMIICKGKSGWPMKIRIHANMGHFDVSVLECTYEISTE
jgi:hypothetical protein